MRGFAALTTDYAPVARPRRWPRFDLVGRLAALALPARRHLDGDLAPGLLALALFLLSRPYLGLDGDARLYIGRVLAEGDPRGVGADFYFAKNDQFGFSLFPPLLRPLVTHLGVSSAGIVVALAASLCCLAGLFALARGLCPGAHRAGWLVVLFVTLLPVSFGTPSMFEFAETAAVPRPFAEAAVLAALACLLRDRFGWSLAFAVVATLLHPIMGLVGLAAVALVLATSHARMAASLAAVAVCTIVAGAALHLPLADRLLVRMDPDWLGLVAHRSAHLFPTRWAASEYANLLVQTATIVIAARLAVPPIRKVLLAILVAGLGAVSAACVFGDGMLSVLFIQAQLWRSVWLVSLTASAALALCAVALARRDDAGRLTLFLLALGWVFVDTVWLAVACALVALTLHVDRGLLSSRIRRRHVVTIGGAIAVAIFAWNLVGLYALVRYWMQPSGPEPSFAEVWHLHLQTVPLLLLAAWWALSRRAPAQDAEAPRGIAVGVAICAAVLVTTGALAWDQRDRTQLTLDEPQAVPGFAASTVGRSREILWVDGVAESWFALGRPQWLSPLQETGFVFSRPLALEWRRRAELALAYGLVRPSLTGSAADDTLRLTEASIRAFCALPDAPGAIVLPPDAPATPGLPGVAWRPGTAGPYRIVPCAAPSR